MGYNKQAYILTKNNFNTRSAMAKEAARMRKAEVENAIPEVAVIARQLSGASADIAIEMARGSKGIEERIKALAEKNLALQARKAELLCEHGYPADYTKVKYICDKCEDTGFVGTRMCDCFHRELIENTIRMSGISALVDTQSFDSFDLKYYAHDPAVLEQMKGNLDILRQYADSFDMSNRSLLFTGPTGLGKTHLSTAVAKAVIEKGYDVLYDTAQNIMSDFEYEQFQRGYYNRDEEKKTDKYFDCDLLIMDDMGTEMVNAFTISALYNLINTRINSGKPMIISTNLSAKELNDRYDNRITSRLVGEFGLIRFTGKDIRLLKIK